MMTNLFSVFDPASSLTSFSNWMSSFLIFLFLFTSFWVIPNRFSIIFKKILTNLFFEIKTLLGGSKPMFGSSVLFIAILLLIVANNFLGLFPYIFTSTAHMICSLSLSLPIWLSFMIYGWFKSYNHMLAHLVPQSTPSALMSFMVVIETISNVIRPLTLAVRLSANMIAGHLLMTLLGNQTSSAMNLTLMILLSTQIILFTLETAVSIIQSYVFAVLSSLYSSESNN